MKSEVKVSQSDVNSRFTDAILDRRYDVAASIVKYVDLNVLNKDVPKRFHRHVWGVPVNYLDILCSSTSRDKFNVIMKLLEPDEKKEYLPKIPKSVTSALHAYLIGKESIGQFADQKDPKVHAAIEALYNQQLELGKQQKIRKDKGNKEEANEIKQYLLSASEFKKLKSYWEKIRDMKKFNSGFFNHTDPLTKEQVEQEHARLIKVKVIPSSPGVLAKIRACWSSEESQAVSPKTTQITLGEHKDSPDPVEEKTPDEHKSKGHTV